MGSITIHVDDEAKPPKSNIASGGKRWKTVPKQTFTAVVHGKKTETSTSTPASNLVLPVTPQIARVRQTGKTIKVEPPVSPGYGELAMLLEEAALLERRLAEGDVDSDKTTQSGALAVEPQPPEATVHMETVPEEDMHNESVLTLTSREESIQDSVRTTEYTDAMSISTRSVSVPSIKEPVLHDDIPEEDEGPFSVPPTPPPKSPIPKYLSGIRRFASSSSSRRSSSHMPGAYPRDSISVSSEDSVATPPDNGFDLNGNGIAWPSVSPKKSSDPVSRSSSFADRFFNRSRTKSNMSHTDGDDISMSRSSTSSRFHTVSGTPDSSPSKRSTTRNLASASLTRPTSTISLASTTSNLGLFDKDIFDAFPSVPETIPPGPVAPQSLLSPDDCPTTVGRSSTMPVKSRKHSAQRFSMA
ncbi:hypothetical protein SERLA73DRAFT_186850 [Serpula lacrymans var. lacrymans S7.3]|uniref:Uncharacterized protein n=2 Tax=Serpula lacrymans var. lacrymans TaxID=341189 RepID=F8Q7Z2_SERL3|nr:uncharacterized protein SERLADRAFT_476108 [Serpula lacrymans var. lacrymans S7.9]EGN95680.1 hypothetical protein SERLA73DRAFT_186850 [Serpula lacrymans var. lacrymans S7.3]EGO21206.1 hypothetical protein SERLADRAFT_476108 [Serpula lacrymans var. lacrymans S7.9]